jgi:hypothetical protein
MAERTLTPAQYAALDEADAALTKLFDESAKKRASAGLRTDDGGAFCLRCSCENFITRDANHGGLGLPPTACGRAGCGHLFTSHNVF